MRQETNAIALLTFYIFCMTCKVENFLQHLRSLARGNLDVPGAVLTNPESYMAEQSLRHKAAGKGSAASQDESSALEQHTQAQSIHGFTIHDVHPAVPQL